MLTLHATESHKCLSFTYHMNGSTIGRLNVFIRGPDSEESLLWRLAGSQGNKWNTATVPIERKSPYQVIQFRTRTKISKPYKLPTAFKRLQAANQRFSNVINTQP